MSWARLLKRVFDIDVEHCPHCGGKLKIIAAIEEPGVIAKILAHLGLPTRAPPRSPPRSFGLLETACFHTHNANQSGSAPEPIIPLGLRPYYTPKFVITNGSQPVSGPLPDPKSPVFEPMPHLIDHSVAFRYSPDSQKSAFILLIPCLAPTRFFRRRGQTDCVDEI